VYGNIVVYGNTALSVYKTDYTLRCLKHIYSVGLLIINTLTNVLTDKSTYQ